LKLQDLFRLAVHLVIAGQISNDTLGLNLLLDAMEKRGPQNVVACSGFKRIGRQS
jgi:hypothetical protein